MNAFRLANLFRVRRIQEDRAAAELAGPLDRPVVVAKSIGTVIATLAIGRRLIQPATAPTVDPASES